MLEASCLGDCWDGQWRLRGPIGAEFDGEFMGSTLGESSILDTPV